MNVNTQRHGAALLWIFIASGFAGLIYQSIWTSYLGLFLGHSAYAQSLVLILFMGGMALGAWLVSRRSETLRRPLLWYAAIELVIGVLGLTFNQVYGWSTGLAYDVLFPGAGSLASVNAIRWTLSVLLVLPQCILLGATFPLMSAGFLRLRPDADGKVIAGLYFTNSIGAAAGALAATYLLVPRVGLPGTVLTAGILNILVAFAVYPISKHEPAATVATPGPKPGADSATPTLILVAAAITGLTSFVYEITWVRMLSLALGTTIHAFELMLAAFIAGIAFGGLWLSRNADRIRSPLKMVGWVQIWMGVAALVSMFVYANAFEWVGWLMRVITRTSEGYSLYNVSSGLIALLVMFPAAFFAGMTLPLLTVILLRNGAGERAIGRVYAANTLGAIVGVLLAVHILLPYIGLKMALWVAAAGDLVLGIVLLRRFASRRFLAQAPVMAGAAAVIALAASLLLVRFDPAVLASSVYRTGATTLGDTTKMLFYRDGKTASVAVYESFNQGKRNWAIATNGKVDAGLSPSLKDEPRSDESTMALLAALPLSLKDKLDEVGVIGFGSGMTTHTLLGSKRVGRIDTVDIEPMMVEGAKVLGPRVHRAYEDPRSHIIIDDAKSYFSSSRRQYDVIISEPSNPWMGGTASLFSSEFYRFIPRHLKRDGLFVQWLQLYEIDQTLVSSVLNAMLPEFNDVQAYLANSGDLILVASPHGKVPPLRDLVSRDAALREELARVGFGTLRDLQDTYALNRQGLTAFASIFPSQANSDYFPVLQLKAPESRFKRDMVWDIGTLLSAPWPITATLADLPVRPLDSTLPNKKREIASDVKLRAARELRTALVDGRPIDGAYARQGDAMQLEALRGLAKSCMLDQAPAQSAQIMISLAIETIPFLDEAANQDLWVKPVWLGNCQPSNPLVVDTLKLLAATSQHRHADVIAAGRHLLSGPESGAILVNQTSTYYVWGAMQLAAFSLDDPSVARELHAQYADKLPASVVGQTPVRMLSALATSGRSEGKDAKQAAGSR
ncbi:fused MFS/spermidine synthase [Lysobacter auxotrophicus]|uniref:Fused MFS/spermidine synthase n=1 Tax=Lysobacter auxotrophicus TaxID=2992573 RepID=A0ABN6UGV8_9GAMM|nr:fused MFS/spermidine synthase [Lysobacter auxotrophicus]BDU15559.1 fused MFS/spermidine synthase [Lysobacter auxotrophicus]